MRMTTTQWRARPVATIAVKTAIVLVPVIAGSAAGLVVAELLPVPPGIALRIGWVLLVLAASTVTLLAFERLARRAAPLALLLRLGMVFPEQVPHRFGVALKATRPRRQEDGERLEAGESLALLASLLAHDRRTRGHSERVAGYALMIAEEMGVDGQERDRLTWGALLHDIGKLQVPAHILTKPSALDDDEWSIMVGHPAFGSALVEPLRPWLGDALSAVDGHHERFDGTGYPYRLLSGALPLAARVAAVADAFETMTAARSYKDPMPIAAARAEVAACAGGHFDPAVCRAFLALSVPRLWRVAGPLSWLAQLPLIGIVVRGELVPVAVSTAAQGAALATGQAVTAAAVVGGALFIGGAAEHGLALDAGRSAPVASVETASGPVADPAGPTPSTDLDEPRQGASGGAGGVTDRPATDPDRPGNEDPTLPDPTDPVDPGSGIDPMPPSGGGGGVVDAVDDVVGGGGGVVDPLVDAVDDVVGGLLSGSGSSGSGGGGSGSSGSGGGGSGSSGSGDGGGGSGSSGSGGGGLLGDLLGGDNRGPG
ncbi:MAG TPA: HD domain-containing phosphohydrolase [Acidimicrobiales bacterium]